jgi:glycosyltransferase involved in cell wall biosynthesis
MIISVITINFNNLNGLKNTFSSIFNQTYQDYEYIVIDGSSTDGSKELIEQNSGNISYWLSEPDRGVYHAMNKGILAAKGEYILFLNSGDELFNNQVLENIQDQLFKSDIISGNLNIISKEKNIIGVSSEKISFFQMYQDTIWHPSTFIKRNALIQTGMYDESFKICADWKWFFHAIFKHQLTYRKVDMVVSKFYMDGMSSDKKMSSIIIEERKKTIREFFSNNLTDVEFLDQLISESAELKRLQGRVNRMKNSLVFKLLKLFRINKLIN